MWHKAIWKGHPMRLELTRVGLLAELANHYTTRVRRLNMSWSCIVHQNLKNFTIMVSISLLQPSQLWLSYTPTAYLQRGKIPFNECPRYDSKQSNGKSPVILELWRMQSTVHCHYSHLQLFSIQLWVNSRTD